MTFKKFVNYSIIAGIIVLLVVVFVREAKSQEMFVGFVVGEQIVPINKKRVALYPINAESHSDSQTCIDAAAATQVDMRAYEQALGQSVVGPNYVAISEARCVSSNLSVEATVFTVENPCTIVLDSGLTTSEQLALCIG